MRLDYEWRVETNTLICSTFLCLWFRVLNTADTADTSTQRKHFHDDYVKYYQDGNDDQKQYSYDI